MESLDRQTTKSTNEGSVSAPGLEQSGDADAPDISLISPSGTTRSDDTAAVKDASAVPHLFSVEDQPDNLVETGDEKQASEPEPSAVIPSQPDEAEDKSAGDLSDAGSQTPLGETQSETGAATDDGSQSNNDDIDMEMILHMEQGRKESRTNDSDSEDRSMAGGNSEVDAAEGEQDHTEENEGQGDPGTEQSQLPHIQEPPDPERSEAQELQVEREEASQDPMRPDPETSQPAFATTGGKPQGLRGRRPSATHLTIAVDSQASPVTVIEARPRAVRDLVHQKGQFLEEDSRASRAIASVANYIDGVGGRPSQEDMEALEEFKTYVAERAKALQEILDGEEPMDALQRFDQRWQQRSLDEAWGDRQDVRLAAVRAAMYLGQDDGNMQGELAISGSYPRAVIFPIRMLFPES